MHERTWAELDSYRSREPQEEWWSVFVKEALGCDTSATADQLLEDPTVITE